MRRCAMRILVLLTLLIPTVWGCSTGEDGQTKSSDGHSRMLALLDKIKDEKRYETTIFGKQWETELSFMARMPDTNLVAQLERNRRLGSRELWHGNTEAAIDYQLTAYKLLPKVESIINSKTRDATTFELALAYMRLAENENCVNCRNGEGCLIPIRRGGVHTDQTGSRKAIEYLSILLERSPNHLEARWLLNIAYMTVGEYPDNVPEKFLIAPSVFESDEEFPRFKNVATKLGLDSLNCCGGSVVDDFDNDGDLDVVTSAWGATEQILYFRNNGDGSFTERGKQAGLEGLYGGLNLIQADYDNDGDIDVLVLRGGWLGERGRMPNSLLQNDGSGGFRDVTFDCGLGAIHYPTQTAGWADYDKDGDLDLYIGNEGYPSQLFKNDGRGSFKDVSRMAGVQNGGTTKGVTWGDYNNDGFPDLYVSNLNGPNRFYVNNGNGSFTDIAQQLGLTQPTWSFAVWFWDFNNDGVLDLFVSSYPYFPDGVKNMVADYLDRPHEAERDHLYQGDGKGGFREVGADQNLTRVTQPMGANFGDLDNDGFPDFYLGTGYPAYEGLMPNLMFRNRGGTGFSNVTTAGGFGHLQKGHGVSFADIDNDGDQDIFIELGGAYPGDRFGNALFENPGFANNWITLKLVGQTSNRWGVGARIRIEVQESGKKRLIYKWVNSGGSFGAKPLRQEIGLGKATTIDRLEVFWPTTGHTQQFVDVPINQFIEITEGKKKFHRLPWKKTAKVSGDRAAIAKPTQ